MKLDILAFGAHPDDVELGCAGTLAKEISLGKKVGIIDLTQGELGTRGSAELRRKEANEAARILQISVRENLCFADGFFLNDKHHQLEIVKKLRKYRPEIVICNPFEDRHIDHGKGGKLVSDACFLSGLRRIETTDENGNPQEAWRPKVVYHYIQWKDLRPDFVVDITGFLEKKIEAVYAYRSQFLPNEGNDPQTVITSQNFQDSIKFRAQELGMLINRDYAEGFNVERYVAVDNLSHLI
ncbi:bacillithiol biosynthesis deacetylase BshB1 [Capnocytophaga granulosa]